MCTPDNFKLTDTPTPSTSLSDKRHKSFPFLNRLDLRATWTNAKQNLTVAGYVNNVLDDVAVLQVLRNSEGEHFRQSAGTTLPRAYGVEVTLNFGGN